MTIFGLSLGSTAKKVIKTFKTEGSYQIGLYFSTLVSSVHVYKIYHKFLWWTWISYDYDMFIPYLSNTYYQGEETTNKKLECVATTLRSEATKFINEIKFQEIEDSLKEKQPEKEERV